MITFLRAQRTRIFWVAVILITILFGLNAWYKSIYSDPRTVFNAMLENSLRTESVTKEVVQNSEGQTLKQTIRLQTGASHQAQSMTDLSQQGIASATVVTESIGTPTADFVRYRSITTDQKNEAGNDLDFSKIIGVWGKTETTDSTSGELYNESTLGIIPFGNLSEADRNKVLAIASESDVYRVEYQNVRRGTINGRPTYEYTVKVLPDAYVTMLKTYARAAGLTHLENINPGNYASADAIEFKVTIDVLTRRLSSVTYATGRQEYYKSYGNQVQVDLPSESVAIEELQQRLQQVE
jgi:hypothetical protein